MNILGIIPARYASSRFPGKPLALINGKSMIQRVYEQVSKSKSISKTVVATDDDRIVDAVINFGGEVMSTSAEHPNGTSRCFEVYKKLDSEKPGFYDAVVNIQGDEPFIEPSQIAMLCSLISKKNTQIATLAKKIIATDELFNPNVVKLVFGLHKNVLYFSRNPIPFNRNIDEDGWAENCDYYKHIGIYGFKPEVFDEINQLTPSKLEETENLEQLRWLENGYQIKADITETETIGIDSPEDLRKLINKS
ncbi:MAG: 3-deoxy-manno-octulosonate cytidylyltransferase [Chlorobi bacterium]|nr:3-deoxy-manno-octulosonate cytidylyltransferase [Chlorobiota bacterium]